MILIILRFTIIISIFLNTCRCEDSNYQELNEDDSYEDYDYYDDNYEDSSSIITEKPIYSNGFILNNVRNDIVIKNMLINDNYIDVISKQYGCLLRKDSFIANSEITNNTNELSKSEHEKKLIESCNNDEYNETNSVNDTNINDNSTNIIKKKLNFREIQQEKLNQQRELKQLKERIKPKYLLGSNCETLVCGSCKSIIEEFSKLIVKSIKDIKIQSIDQLFDGFCNSRELTLRYDNIVSDICYNIINSGNGYQNFILNYYESQSNWQNLLSNQILYTNQKHICTIIGACDSTSYHLQLIPRNKYEDHWDNKCFICQAFANNLEERVQLARYLTEKSILPVVMETCDRLNLEKEYDDICRVMIGGTLVDDIAWLAKVNDEGIEKKLKSEKKFGDTLCEQIKYCEKYLDPEEIKQIEAEEEIDVMLF